MHWQRSPYDLYRHSRLRERAGEPFTPNIPSIVSEKPALTGAALATLGVFGTWLIVSQMATWPNWTLFPSMMLAMLSLLAMMLGFVLLTIRWLEPVISRMDLNWDADPVGSLGLPPTLQSKLESLGFWSADDVCRAVERGKFPWLSLELSERRVIESAVAFHSAKAAEAATSDSGRRSRASRT
ncbi:MAG: hypothetical protein M9890_14550 [Thermomicrobiales bacterium]|nr:hypothetical protein [Thermomicrobiales bacterium]